MNLSTLQFTEISFALVRASSVAVVRKGEIRL
jgi:hypothetical protein